MNNNFIVLAPNNNDVTDILVIHVHDRRILKGEELKDFRLRVAPGIALVNVQEAWKDLRH